MFLEHGEIRRLILELVNSPGYRPVKPKGLARQMGIEPEQVKEVRKIVKRMVLRGELAWGSNHMVQPGPGAEFTEPTKEKRGRPSRRGKSTHWIIGTFRRNAKGFGFVRPRTQEVAEEGDIYIPAKRTGDASSGDVVAVELMGRGRRFPGPRGEIVKILERQTNQFVGTYFERGAWAFVEVDGGVFAQPVVVGDPSASKARVGDKVVIEMLRFPSHERDGEAVLTEILGQHGQTGLDTLLVMREFNLPERFEEETRLSARRIVESFDDETIPKGRDDATAETTVTIDPPDARDYDDAISLREMENGHWLLGVHIADVSYFVREDSALDQAARDRATSVYLPDQVVPMLPEVLSNGLASLQPDKLRLTKSAYLEFDAEGVLVSTKVRNAVIRSDQRLTYDQVGSFLEDAQPWRELWGEEVAALLSRMYRLAMILRDRRIRRGALELTLPEVKVEFDDAGRVADARIAEHYEPHQIIEEFMLAANEAVAAKLHDAGVPFLRRIHEPPALRKLRLFGEFVEEVFRAKREEAIEFERELEEFGAGVFEDVDDRPEFGGGDTLDEGGAAPEEAEVGPDIASIDPQRLASRFEIQRLLKAVEGRPEEKAVNYFLLRSLQRAEYSPREEGHFALASDCYCHFTSPIRRYPDLHIHRLLERLIEGKKPRLDVDALLVLGQHCSDRERRAEQAERELTKLKLLDYMSRRIGQRVTGVVTGIESFGLFVQGVRIPAEGLVRIDSMADDYYHFDRATWTLMGRRKGNTYRLGDIVRVEVIHVDMDRRELDLRVVGRLSHDAALAAVEGELPQDETIIRKEEPDAGRFDRRGEFGRTARRGREGKGRGREAKRGGGRKEAVSQVTRGKKKGKKVKSKKRKRKG